MATSEHSVGFEPADKLAQDRDSVRRRFWIKFKRVMAKLPIAEDLLEAFAQQLLAAGVDVARITTGVPILHPQIFSFSGLWELGNDTTERLFRSGPDTTVTLANSPIGIAYQGGGPVRCDLTAPPR